MRFWLLLCCWLAGSAAAETRSPQEFFFHQSFGDLREELQIARDEGLQGILVMFEMDDCPFCHRMKTQVLNRSEVQDYFRGHFRVLSIDVEGDIELTDFAGQATTMKEFASRNRVRATPVFQFFDLDGKPIKEGRYTGATRDADEFMLLGRFIADGGYRQTTFIKYKRAEGTVKQ